MSAKRKQEEKKALPPPESGEPLEESSGSALSVEEDTPAETSPTPQKAKRPPLEKLPDGLQKELTQKLGGFAMKFIAVYQRGSFEFKGMWAWVKEVLSDLEYDTAVRDEKFWDDAEKIQLKYGVENAQILECNPEVGGNFIASLYLGNFTFRRKKMVGAFGRAEACQDGDCHNLLGNMVATPFTWEGTLQDRPSPQGITG